uniref:Uncharacterized protein n=1 Tax=Chromera velia CCMP2878 TaxID=1169474 RepID=A0A0G4F7N5_9ALVE|eukprot:Cvel_15446.t1-p1 / transcript=Cvel_15446.t1 / gene=Cvel_15446 / organism=Chromera_velia_CCMP2878 / gene_product=hypothetical protein / transcript_product=hypothetical protein / location=Cvel_scaffold1143:28023-35748(-) / protein_length=612 / sequence_SO=supercontig / SO=protein_coding / is_pseudo=false
MSCRSLYEQQRDPSPADAGASSPTRVPSQYHPTYYYQSPPRTTAVEVRERVLHLPNQQEQRTHGARKTTTKPVPFSFEARDQLRSLRRRVLEEMTVGATAREREIEREMQAREKEKRDRPSGATLTRPPNVTPQPSQTDVRILPPTPASPSPDVQRSAQPRFAPATRSAKPPSVSVPGEGGEWLWVPSSAPPPAGGGVPVSDGVGRGGPVGSKKFGGGGVVMRNGGVQIGFGGKEVPRPLSAPSRRVLPETISINLSSATSLPRPQKEDEPKADVMMREEQEWQRKNLVKRGLPNSTPHFACKHTGAKAPPQQLRENTQISTREVPDFLSLHERERFQLEKRKQTSRRTTVPQPFALHGQPGCSLHSTKGKRACASMPQMRFYQERLQMIRSRSARQRRRGKGAGSGRTMAPSLVPAIPPPRNTQKTLAQMQYTQEMLRKREELQRTLQEEMEAKDRYRIFMAHCREEKHKHLPRTLVPSWTEGDFRQLKDRVDSTVRRHIDNHEETKREFSKIDREQDPRASKFPPERPSEKYWDWLKEAKQKVKQRPLLMERGELLLSMRRQRVRCLNKLRKAMRKAGMTEERIHRAFADEDRLLLEEQDIKGQQEDGPN